MGDNRYNKTQNYVTPVAMTQQPQRLELPATWTNGDIYQPATTIFVDESLQSHDGSSEKTSAMDRATALVVRLAPFSVVWLVLSVGVSWAVGMGGWFILVAFAALTAVTYAYLDLQEYQFSRNGLERHKVDTLADLKLAEMDHQQELRRMALQAHLRMLGVDNERH
ncbi:MAG: hypothetical protein R3C14_54340 [Caldilineaceae bacterium]